MAIHGNTKPLKTQTLCCGAPCGSTVWGEAAEQMNRVRRRLSCRLQAGSIAGPTLTCVAQGTGLQDTFYGSFRANEGSQAPPGLQRGQSAPSAHPNLEPSSPCPLPGQRMGSKAPHSTARQRAKARPRSPKHGGCAQLSRVGDASRAPPDTHRDTTGEGGPSHRLPPGLKPLDDPLGSKTRPVRTVPERGAWAGGAAAVSCLRSGGVHRAEGSLGQRPQETQS